MSVACAGRFEAGLRQRHLRPAANIRELDGYKRLVAGHALFLPSVRHHEAAHWNDLAIDAAQPEQVTLGRSHLRTPLAARAQIALALRDREAARRAPLREMLLLGEALPQQRNRSV